MNILFIASEGSPFVKTGGLADVIGSLPAELTQKGMKVAVMMPNYGDISGEMKAQMELVSELEVHVGWRRKYCGLKKMAYGGVTYYFIDNEYYFLRNGLYGFLDEAERFAFFCQAALACLPHLDVFPDILHCHDWQTGPVSVYLKSHFRGNPSYSHIKTVFTIHNLHYRGTFPVEVLEGVLGLSRDYYTTDNLEFYNQISYLKGGLVFSDMLTTVSKTYAKEIQTPDFGEQLEGVLRRRKNDLYGVLNGVDYGEYNPMSDPAIYENYQYSLLKKQRNKEGLQEYLGLPKEKDAPLVAVITRMVKQKVEILSQALTGLLALNIQLVVLGTGDDRYMGYFQHYANQFKHKMVTCPVFDEGLARRIYAGSDIFLMPSLFEPCGLSQLIAMRYGSIPVVRETGGLKDTVIPYKPKAGKGTGFSFRGYESQDFLEATKKAVNLYKDKKAWASLVKNAVKADFSWSNSADEYLALYKGLHK